MTSFKNIHCILRVCKPLSRSQVLSGIAFDMISMVWNINQLHVLVFEVTFLYEWNTEDCTRPNFEESP